MNKRLKKVLILNSSILIGGILYYIFSVLFFPIPCFFERVCGIECISCGMNTLAHAVIRFDFVGAFQANWYMCITLPILAPFYLYNTVLYAKDRELNWKLIFIVIGLFIVLGAIYMIHRNL